MEHGHEQEAWQIDPVTAIILPPEAIIDPVVVVVEATPSLSITTAVICDFLRTRVEHVTDIRDLDAVLRDTMPIAVLTEASAVDCAIYDLLMTVAGYDPGLAVMLVIDDHPAAKGAVEAAQKLWQLQNVMRLTRRPGIRVLIDFLFVAGRRRGAGRLVPL